MIGTLENSLVHFTEPKSDLKVINSITMYFRKYINSTERFLILQNSYRVFSL